jgi:SET domain-containing protein
VKPLQPIQPTPGRSPTCEYEVPVLEICEAGRKGYGVFAASFIPSGARILQLEGHIFKSQDVPPDSMAMQIEDDLWLCSDGTLLDDRINHSCDPNTGFARNDLVLYALRDIALGEELSWDYSTSISEPGWSLVCFCESEHCRRVILPFGDLTLEQQLRLGPIALRYLHRHMRAKSLSPGIRVCRQL